MIALGAVVLLLASLFAFERFAPGPTAAFGLAVERRRAGLAWDCASIPGAEMPYLEGGDGETIVLLHGFGGDKDHFIRTALYLTGRYHVVIPDLPAFGEASRHAGDNYSIAHQVANLRAFLDKLGLDRVHLGGNSMGGFIATEFAACHPGMVGSLWLLNAAGTAAAFDTPVARHYHASGEIPTLLRSPDDFDQLLVSATAQPPFVPSSVRRSLGLRGAADFALHTRVMRQVQSSPFLEARYYRIETPALIVWGSEDRILNPAGAAALQAILPRSQVIILPGVGHLPMLEAPQRCARDYLAFLAGLQQARAA